MHPVIAKTFGGLSPSYYVRQFLFELVYAAVDVCRPCRSVIAPVMRN